MNKLFNSSEFTLGASIGMIVVVSGLVGHNAAAGMNGAQWFFGLIAIGGSITLAVVLRCWPAPKRAEARIDDR
jgi:hypothetical protein